MSVLETAETSALADDEAMSVASTVLEGRTVDEAIAFTRSQLSVGDANNVIDAIWVQMIGARPTLETLRACGDYMDNDAVDQVAQRATRLAWRCRGSLPASVEDQVVERLRQSIDTDLRFEFFFLGQMNRFLFQHRRLDALIHATGGRYDDEALTAAFRLFVSLADARAGALEGVTAWFEGRAQWRTADFPMCLHVVLTGMWLAPPTEDLGQEMTKLSRQMTNLQPANPISWFRLAYALRVSGRLGEAHGCLDEAFHLLSGDSVVFLHEQFLREREQLRTAEAQARASAEIANATSMIEKFELLVSATEVRINAAIDNQILRSVELLGLFAAAITFVLGGVQLAATADTFWESAGWLTALGVVLLLFLGGIRVFVATSDRR
jgi:hypothetical protein